MTAPPKEQQYSCGTCGKPIQRGCYCSPECAKVDDMPPDEPIPVRHPFQASCRSCGAPIVWFRTAKGHRMPVDAATCKPTDAEHQLDLTRHISHFATCPNAGQHRRKR